MFGPSILGEHVRVDLKPDLRVAGRIVTAEDTHIELRFDQPIDVAGVAQAQAHSRKGSRPDAPRLDVLCEGLLQLRGEGHLVEVRDLSQGGARIATPLEPAIAEPVTLTVAGLPPIDGIVRWSEAGGAGISFVTPLPLESLTEWTVGGDAPIGAQQGSRRWPRYSVLVRAWVHLGDVNGPVEILLHNISRGGAHVTCPRGLHVGEELELRLGPAGRVGGSVVWIDGDHAGVGFSRTIDDGHVLRPFGERSLPPLLHHRVEPWRPAVKTH